MSREKSLKERFADKEIASELTNAWARRFILPSFKAENCLVLDQERSWVFDVEQIGLLRTFNKIAYPVLLLAIAFLAFGWTNNGFDGGFYVKGNPTVAVMAFIALSFIFLQNRRLRRASDSIVEWYPADLRFSQNFVDGLAKLERMVYDMGFKAFLPLADFALCKQCAEKKMLELVKDVLSAESKGGKKSKSKSTKLKSIETCPDLSGGVSCEKHEVRNWHSFLLSFDLVDKDVSVYYNKVAQILPSVVTDSVTTDPTTSEG